MKPAPYTEADRERNACHDGPIHGWFELTYANYLVLPRSLMQSMPVEWQERMTRCLEEAREAFRAQAWPPTYRVQAVGDDGRFMRDPVPHYDRGRAFVPPEGDEDLAWVSGR